MLSKRAFLGGAGALLVLPLPPAGAVGESAGGSIRLEPLERSLVPAGPAVETVTMRAGEAGSVLEFAASESTPVHLANASGLPITPTWQGLRGVGSRSTPMPVAASGAAADLAVAPREPGTGLLRAAPDAANAAARGARMAVVVRDRTPSAVDQDHVLLLEDWLLGADGRLRFGSTPPGDAVMSVVTVNGEAHPRVLTVAPRTRLRLRFVNGSVQRLMLIACIGGKPMIAAIDGQPSDLFAPARAVVPIGPGARYDLLLDAPETAGAEVRFALKPTLLLAGKPEDGRDLVVIRTEGAARSAPAPLTPLPVNPGLPAQIPLEAAHRADLAFAGQPGTATTPPRGWTVNGVPGGDAASKPVLTVRSGDAVVLGLSNTSATLVPLRISGQAVRLLHAKDDGWEPYWRDTLLLPPGSRNHVAFVADAPGVWTIDSGFDDLTLVGLSCCFAVMPR